MSDNKDLETWLDSFEIKDDPFGKRLNRQKATKEIEEIAPFFLRPEQKCSCTDVYCPHKGNGSTMGLFLLQNRLAQCYTYEHKFLDVLHSLHIREMPITKLETYPGVVLDEEGYVSVIIGDNELYTHPYLRLSIKRRANAVPSRFQDSLMEGVRVSDPQVKKVVFLFNGLDMNSEPGISTLDGTIFYCPFFILLAALQFTHVEIRFYNEQEESVIVPYETIGGFTSYPLTRNYKAEYIQYHGTTKIRVIDGIMTWNTPDNF